MCTSAHVEPVRKGFTLVEMLVVIVIIGILTALLTGAVVMARAAARKAVIRADISQLETALENYRNEVGELPPSFTNINIVAERPTGDPALQADGRAAVIRHLRKAFPRYVPGDVRNKTWPAALRNPEGRPDTSPYDKFANDVYYAYGGSGTVDPIRFDAASALVFFLGGLPESASTSGAWIPAGFHSDPTFPFKPGLPRTKPQFSFDAGRVVWRESHYEDPNNSSSPQIWRYLRYYPQGVEGSSGAPYAYFRARRISGAAPYDGTWQYGAISSVSSRSDPLVQYDYQHSIVGVPLGNNCVPYRDPQNPPVWRNRETCQIIAAGLDGQFGTAPPDDGTQPIYRFSRTAVNFTDGDYDNITNFLSTGELEDEIE